MNATVVGTGTFAVQAAQSGTWNIGTVTTLPSIPAGSNLIGAVNIEASGTALTATGSSLNVNITGGSSGNGAASATGSAVPSQAGYTGFNSGGNLVGVSSSNPLPVTAVQSGTWNIGTITSVTNTVTTSDTHAYTQGSTTSGQSGFLHLGAVTTSSPSYTTAQSSPLSLTTAGALRVDASATTQPISGTVTASQGTAANLNATVVGTGTFAVQAAQSGTWNIGSITTLPSLPTGANTIGAVNVNGTVPVSGTFWQTTQPISGTVTVNAGTNLNTSALALESGGNLATIAGAVSSSKVQVNVTNSSIPVTGTFWQTTQPVSGTVTANISGSISNTSFAATQATAANLNATVVGTGTFAVQAAQSGTWNIGSITTLPSIPAGTNMIGQVEIYDGTNIIGTSGHPVQVSLANTGSNATVINTSDGNALSQNASASSAKGFLELGIAATAYPTAATGGNTVAMMLDKAGRQVTVANTVRNLVGTAVLTATSTSPTTLISTVASTYTDIISLTMTNESSSATVVSLSDGTTTYKFALAANGGITFNPTTPLPATSVNTAWTIAITGTVSVDCIAIYAKNQ